MARSRNIKPGFYKNEDLAECSVWARLIFPGLWMLADREGRLEDRPKRIKGELLPYDAIDVEPLLQELHKWGFINRYIADGKKVIRVISFSEHQSPHGKEADSEFADENGFYTVHYRDKKSGCVTGKYTKTNTSTVLARDKNETSTVLAHPESGLLNPESGLLNPESGLLNPESVDSGFTPPEKTKKTKTARFDYKTFALPDCIDKTMWDGWMEVRKRKRAAMTEFSLSEHLKTLLQCNDMGINPNAALVVARKREWIGIEVEWVVNALEKTNQPTTTISRVSKNNRPDYKKIYGDGSVIDSTAMEIKHAAE